MATATLSWQGKTRTTTAGAGDQPISKTAQKIYTVIGATDENDAEAASGVPAINDQYDGTDSTLLCRGFTTRLTSPGVYEVAANFQTAPNGNWETSNPLLQPCVVQWQTVTVTEPMDRDIYGNAIVNSAGDPPSSPLSRTYVYHVLRITKNKAFFDYATLRQYENTVNLDPMTYTEPNGNTVTFDEGTVKCVSIEPNGPYKATDKFVPVTFTFEIWDLSNQNENVGTDQPHQARFLDTGRTGWYADDDGNYRQGYFCTKEGTAAPCDIRLDSTGYPVANEDDEKWFVRDGDNIASAESNPTDIPDDVDVESTSDAYYLVYKRYKEVSYSGLASQWA